MVVTLITLCSIAQENKKNKTCVKTKRKRDTKEDSDLSGLHKQTTKNELGTVPLGPASPSVEKKKKKRKKRKVKHMCLFLFLWRCAECEKKVCVLL